MVVRMDELSVRIADRFKTEVVRRKITQGEFAAALGVSETSIHRYLNAKRRFNSTEIVKGVDYLNRHRAVGDAELTIAEVMDPENADAEAMAG